MKGYSSAVIIFQWFQDWLHVMKDLEQIKFQLISDLVVALIENHQ